MSEEEQASESPSSSSHCYAADDPRITLSTHGLTEEIVILVMMAIKMFTDEDTVEMFKGNDEKFIVSKDLLRRVLEVNEVAENLIQMMKKAGDTPSA